MNIALIDLNHKTLGIHTNTIPLGIGGIAYYLKSNVTHQFDIRLFKDHDKFLEALKNWKVDVLAITQYSWNSELNLYMAELTKKCNPDCVIIVGGPNLYLDSEGKFNYLKKYNFVDISVNYDGEIPFAEVVKRLIEGETISEIRKTPTAGTYSIDSEKGCLIESKEPAPRLSSLDVFNSIYAEEFFNELLDDGYHPFLQTQRGCPYRCAYCHTGNDYCSRVIFQSSDHFRKDLEYLGKRFSGQHNITLYMANTNFGLFKEDLEIARAIRHIQDKYDWPRNIDVNSGGNFNRLSEMLSILKYKFFPVNALQTLTPRVLRNIRRKNLSLQDFITFQKKTTRDLNKHTETELILSLPGETKKSFLNGLSRVLDSGVQNTVIYTLMALKGTSIASEETASRFDHVIRHRIVPRCFSDIGGKKIFEIEDVVIGTKAMPYEDYLQLRGLALIITVFASSVEMFPLRKLLMEEGVKISDWIFGIYNNISDFKDLYAVYESFLKETANELFPSREALIDFFGKKENYKLLLEGTFGDNLLRKYKAVMLCQYYKESLEAARKQASTLSEKLRPMLPDLIHYLKSRDVGNIFTTGYTEEMSKSLCLCYDIPEWLDSDEDVPLQKYKGRFCYEVSITVYMQDRLKNFIQMNRDPQLSAQILYRDGYIKDFWPEWKRDRNAK